MYSSELSNELSKSEAVCESCFEAIEDRFCYVIDDTVLCKSCMNENYRKPTADYSK